MNGFLLGKCLIHQQHQIIFSYFVGFPLTVPFRNIHLRIHPYDVTLPKSPE